MINEVKKITVKRGNKRVRMTEGTYRALLSIRRVGIQHDTECPIAPRMRLTKREEKRKLIEDKIDQDILNSKLISNE